MLNRNRTHMPADFEPPVPAWAARWSDASQAVTTACFAVQGAPPPVFAAWIRSALQESAAAPAIVERARFTDLAGLENHVWIAYWVAPQYQAWLDAGGLDWWDDAARLDEGQGYWREQFTVPVDRLETLHSTPNPHGVAGLAVELEGPVAEHAYSGAMRDRIPVSAREDLRVAQASAAGLQQDQSGRRVRMQPPHNLCVIRSGQDWTHCGEDERRFYHDALRPKLEIGMDYLSRNPEESRCLCMRLMTTTSPSGAPTTQSFGLGFAVDIFAFEEWARSHPTHLEIFGNFMHHAQRFGEQMQLRLWHEVSVVPAGAGEFEYINCHPETGLLRLLQRGES